MGRHNYVYFERIKDKVKSSEQVDMVVDQAEQLDVLLNQSAEVLNKNHDNEETDACMTSKWDNRSPLTIKMPKLEE